MREPFSSFSFSVQVARLDFITPDKTVEKSDTSNPEYSKCMMGLELQVSAKKKP